MTWKVTWALWLGLEGDLDPGLEGDLDPGLEGDLDPGLEVEMVVCDPEGAPPTTGSTQRVT